jgi:hypothetical protein
MNWQAQLGLSVRYGPYFAFRNRLQSYALSDARIENEWNKCWREFSLCRSDLIFPLYKTAG